MSDVSENMEGIRRQLKQRLDGLGRLGVSRIPLSLSAKLILDSQRDHERDAEQNDLPMTQNASIERVVPELPRTTKAQTSELPVQHPLPLEKPIMATRRPTLFEAVKTPAEFGPPMKPAERPAALEVIEHEIAACKACPSLIVNRTNTVPGEGNPVARLVFMGEAPGADEDKTGRPFVGRGGQLLTDMITKGMGLKREEIFILNTIKCRPPENRVPLPEEQANCRGFLERQLEIIRTEFLCLLGKTAALAILEIEGSPASITMATLRGRWFDYRGIRTIVSFHPAYLLRNPSAKKDAWEDLKRLMDAMGLAIPTRS